MENMHVHLYRRLQLSAEQRHSMAALWHAWERRRRALTASMHSALDTLRGAPDSVRLPLDAITHISDLAAGRVSRPSACDLSTPDGGAAAAAACGCGCAAAAAAVAAAAAQPQLLGAAPALTAAAADALRALQAVHDADADGFVDTVQVAMQPGLVLSPEQHLRYICAHRGAKAAPADFMAICQLAATQARRADLFGKPNF